MRRNVFLSALLLTLVSGYDYWRKPYKLTDECQEHDEECKFIFVVESKLTMLSYDGLAVPHEGKLYGVDDKNFTNPIDEDAYIQGDGYHKNSRLVIVVNNSLPGPPIEVFEDQTVVVEVRNRLISEGVTIHWHGVLQTDNNFMDGVAYVNQCPIAAGTSFTYRFKTDKSPGTNFYHAHIGAQRTQGLFGPLIVRMKTKNRKGYELYSDFTMVVNDWNHDYDSNTAHLKASYGTYDEEGNKYSAYKVVDNSDNIPFQWQSGLINGKGRYYDPATGSHNQAPLTVFKVKKDGTVRFKVISAGTYFPLRISIDQHDLVMISTDSYQFQNITVESFIINPGERFDFLVTADKESGSYWIYAETLEVDAHGNPLSPPHRAEAIFEYEDKPMDDTNYDDNVELWSNRTRCTQDNVCYVLNCHFPRDFKLADYQKCKYLTDLQASCDEPQFGPEQDFEEHFYNFAFAGSEGGSINGRHWLNPHFSAASQTRELDGIDTKCTKCDETETCACTHTAVLEHNKFYQFVLMSSGKGTGGGHPIHLHGHNFQVVKQGFFYPLDEETKKLPDGPHTSPDITCLGDSGICNSAKWANESWSGNGLNSEIIGRNPILKDTVIVPTGGYTVIRFKANNPGFWYMHCHIEVHNTAGMSMMFNEAPRRQKKWAPTSFPVCRNYPSKHPLDDLTIGFLVGFSIASFLLILLISLLICGHYQERTRKRMIITTNQERQANTPL